MNNLKVAVICNSYPTRINKHNQIFIKNINHELGKLSVTCDVYYNPIYDYWFDPSSHKNIFSILVKYSFFFAGLFRMFGRLKNYTILNPHGVILSGFSVAVIKSFFKIPVVLYIHGGDLNLYQSSSAFYRKIYDFSVYSSDIVIVNSNDIKEKLLLYTRVNQEKVRVISPGINLKQFFPLPKNKIKNYRNKYLIDQNKIVLLFVGNAIKRKGLDILVDALSILTPEQQKKIELILCTEGPELIKINKKIKNMPILGKSTKIIRKVQQDELNKLYNMANIFIIPSREEPLGLVGLEAIASGTPVIGANVGGIPEYINNKNGLLFDPKRPQDLAEIIKKLIDNPNKIVELTSNMDMGHTKHSISNSAIAIKGIFELFI